MPVMIAISMQPRDRLRRLSLVGALVCLVALALVPWLGAEVNGAKRWLNLGVGQFQPSEFLKPFFVVSMAWLLEPARNGQVAADLHLVGAASPALVAFLLMRQPDFGSTIIFAAVWIAMLAIAGLNLRILVGLGIAGAGRDRPGLFLLRRGDRAHRRLPVRRGRQFPDRECDAHADRGRAVRHGAGGGDAQVRPARAAYRLYLLGDRRGVRADRLPDDRPALSRHRRAGAGQAARRGIQLRHPRRRRAWSSSSGCRR